MNVETSSKILRFSGILSIIFGILGVVLGIMAILGGGLLEAEGPQVIEEGVTVGGMAILAGVIMLISGIFSVLEGIFSVKAANDNTKIMPAWIFAILGVISSVGSSITSVANGENFASGIVSVALSILIFVAANTIKNSVNK